MERARQRVAGFLHASKPELVSFVRDATEARHAVANRLASTALQKGDEIVLTALEHHSNILPWLMTRERTGAGLRVAPLTPSCPSRASRPSWSTGSTIRRACRRSSTRSIASLSAEAR